MKKLSNTDIIKIAVATVATATVVAGAIVIAKKCKKAIDEYEKAMLDAENAEQENCETCETPCEAACEEACENDAAEEACCCEEASAEETCCECTEEVAKEEIAE